MQGMRMVIKFKTAHVQRLEHALAARSSEEMADAAFLAQKSHSTSLQHELQVHCSRSTPLRSRRRTRPGWGLGCPELVCA